MPQCVTCGGSASSFSQKRCMDGPVCQSCLGRMPHVLHGSIALFSADMVQAIMEYEDQMKQKGFEATASYGKLYLDELNGMFAIAEKSGQKGTLTEADYFDCAYLENIGIYPVDPRQSRKDIVCDVEFSASFRYPQMRFRLKVRSGVKCDFKQITKTQAEWSEPGELSMFRNMLDQTIRTSVKKALEEREQVITPYDLDLLKARACLHVYEGCPANLLLRQYTNLMQMYRDGGYTQEEKDACTGALERYYRLLLSEEGYVK